MFKTTGVFGENLLYQLPRENCLIRVCNMAYSSSDDWYDVPARRIPTRRWHEMLRTIVRTGTTLGRF
jgi:hypothetical protein